MKILIIYTSKLLFKLYMVNIFCCIYHIIIIHILEIYMLMNNLFVTICYYTSVCKKYIKQNLQK